MTDLGSAPGSLSGVEHLDKADLRRIFDAWAARLLDSLPKLFTGQAGNFPALNADGTAYSLSDPIDLKGRGASNAALRSVTVSGTSLTIDSTNAASYRGRLIRTTSGSAVTITVAASAGDGFHATLRQVGAGQVTFAAGSGMTAGVKNRSSHTKTAAQDALVSFLVDGTELCLGGDTAA